MSEKDQLFLQLLPATLAIAGLPTSEHGKYFNEDQMDLRMRTILKAYKFCKQLAKEAADQE